MDKAGKTATNYQLIHPDLIYSSFTPAALAPGPILPS